MRKTHKVVDLSSGNDGVDVTQCFGFLVYILRFFGADVRPSWNLCKILTFVIGSICLVLNVFSNIYVLVFVSNAMHEEARRNQDFLTVTFSWNIIIDYCNYVFFIVGEHVVLLYVAATRSRSLWNVVKNLRFVFNRAESIVLRNRLILIASAMLLLVSTAIVYNLLSISWLSSYLANGFGIGG